MKKASPSRRPGRILNLRDYRAERQDRSRLSHYLTPAVRADWYAPQATMGRGRGAVPRFSDGTIRVFMEIKLAFGRSFSGVVGLVEDHFRVRRIALDVPDESTLCRRAQALGTAAVTALPGVKNGLFFHLPAPAGTPRPWGLVHDSTGFTIRGVGLWRGLRPHGRETGDRREWLKVHVALDPRTGRVWAVALTPCATHDNPVAVAMMALLQGAGHRLQTIAADGAYDSHSFYQAAVDIGCTRVLVPPRSDATPWVTEGPKATPGAGLRNDHWALTVAGERSGEDDRRAVWKRTSGYGGRNLIESFMSRMAVRTGSRCRGRTRAGRQAEVVTLMRLLNREAERCQPLRYYREWAHIWGTPVTRAA